MNRGFEYQYENHRNRISSDAFNVFGQKLVLLRITDLRFQAFLETRCPPSPAVLIRTLPPRVIVLSFQRYSAVGARR